PGSGPVGVKKDLVPFLPSPRIELADGKYRFNDELPLSVGRLKAFYGNFLVMVKAYCYILSLGAQGLLAASQGAVLNANYVLNALKEKYHLPYQRICMHECVLSGKRQKEHGVSTLDVAKRLLDFGYHPPTIYFPLIVEEALMIEPTECESRVTLDEFIAACLLIAEEAERAPELVKGAPYTTFVRRLDEAAAARTPVLRWKKG
ncbi:MAG: aminomethyl-transferring glycine dehydrogenase subunit GcvPB, partial [Clostridiales bacterium]|nr:aminomethyl-transferring glycine dehydrogenase subunit GcvPB [Clostridiales bacterium]